MPNCGSGGKGKTILSSERGKNDYIVEGFEISGAIPAGTGFAEGEDSEEAPAWYCSFSLSSLALLQPLRSHLIRGCGAGAHRLIIAQAAEEDG